MQSAYLTSAKTSIQQETTVASKSNEADQSTRKFTTEILQKNVQVHRRMYNVKVAELQVMKAEWALSISEVIVSYGTSITKIVHHNLQNASKGIHNRYFRDGSRS